ncbi:hypothetical protein JCM5350_001020 [Sporobolomyces pararoseus]
MSATSFKAQGNEYFNKEEWEKAIDCYSKAIELEKDPISSAPLFANRAAAYLEIGKLEKAEEDAYESTCRDQHYSKGFARRAEVNIRTEHFELAEACYDRAIKETTDTVAQDRYREAIHKLRNYQKTSAFSGVSSEMIRDASTFKNGETWPARIEHEKRINGYKPRPGSHISFLQAAAEVCSVGVAVLDQAVEITESGGVVGTPLSVAGRIISETLLLDPAAFIVKCEVGTISSPHAKLTRLNELDWRACDCLRYFKPSPLTPAEIVEDLDKRIAREGFANISAYTSSIINGSVITSWSSAIQHLDLAQELQTLASSLWSGCLPPADEDSSFGIKPRRILQSRALQLYNDGYEYSLEKMESLANAIVQNNPRRLWPKEMEDVDRLGYYVLPLAQAYAALGFVAASRARIPLEVIPRGKVAIADLDLAKRSARYYTLAATLLPDDHYRKAAHLWRDLDQHIVAGGKTTRELLDLESQALKLVDERERLYGPMFRREIYVGPQKEVSRSLETSRPSSNANVKAEDFEKLLNQVSVPLLTVNVTDMPSSWDWRLAIFSFARDAGYKELPMFFAVRNLAQK